MKNNLREDTDFHFPIHGTKYKMQYANEFPYVPLVHSPGAAFIVSSENAYNQSKRVIQTFLDSWTFILVLVLASYMVGLIMWLIVSSCIRLLIQMEILFRFFSFIFSLFIFSLCMVFLLCLLLNLSSMHVSGWRFSIFCVLPQPSPLSLQCLSLYSFWTSYYLSTLQPNKNPFCCLWSLISFIFLHEICWNWVIMFRKENYKSTRNLETMQIISVHEEFNSLDQKMDFYLTTSDSNFPCFQFT